MGCCCSSRDQAVWDEPTAGVGFGVQIGPVVGTVRCRGARILLETNSAGNMKVFFFIIIFF